MKPLALNLSKMKKVGGDEKHSVFQHPDGHQIKVAHAPLSSLQKEQIRRMPVHKYADGTPDVSDLTGEGGSSVPGQEDALPPQSAPQESPDPSIASDAGQILRDSIGSTAAGLGQVFSPVLHGVGDFVKSLSGSQDQPQGPDQAQLPPAATDLPGMGQAIGSQPTSDRGPGAAQPMQSPINLQGAYEQGLRGIQEGANVSAQLAKEQADRDAQDLQIRQGLINDSKNNYDAFSQHQQQFMQDYANGHIDPNSYLENMSVPKKIATAIGLLLGGAGAGRGVNPGVQFLNEQINRNINAQQVNMDKSKTLLGANQALYGDQVLAQNQTRVNMNDMLSHQIQMDAANLGTPQAKALADQTSAQYKMQNLPLLQQNAIRAAVLKNINSTGGRGIDALDLAHAGFMSPEEAQKEQASANSAKTAVNTANNIFSQMNQEQTTQNALNPESSRRMDALMAQLTPLAIDENPSKRLTEESYEKEVAPLKIMTTDDQQTRLSKQQGMLNLIRLAHEGNTPNMAKYASGSLPNYDVMTPQQNKTSPRVGEVRQSSKDGTYWQYVDANGSKKQVRGPNG